MRRLLGERGEGMIGKEMEGLGVLKLDEVIDWEGMEE